MTWGGGEKQILYLMSELRKKKIHQMLVCPVQSALSIKTKEAEFKVHELKRTSLLPIVWAFAIRSLIKNDEKIILHTHDGKAHNCAYIYALLNPEIPIIVHRRLVKTNDSFYNRLKYNHPSIKKVISISSAVQRNVNFILKDPSRSVLIPSGIKIDIIKSSDEEKDRARSKMGLSKGSHLILNIGSMLEQKQQKFFLNLARLFFEKHPLRKQDVYFAILGDGPLMQDLASYIATHSLNNNCLLLGFSKQAQVILESADMLVSTSINEALGNVFMEALVLGVPVLASDSGGIRDLIVDGETGLLAEPLDEEDFLKNLEQLLDDYELRNKMTISGYKKLDSFNIEKTAEALYKIYLSI
jgi:glycosyltransferase involved in cell wall biosynthesis